jgi:hypothetical protein
MSKSVCWIAETTEPMRFSSSYETRARRSGKPNVPSGKGPTTCRDKDDISDHGRREEGLRETDATINDDSVLSGSESEFVSEPLELFPEELSIHRLISFDSSFEHRSERVSKCPILAVTRERSSDGQTKVDPGDEFCRKEISEAVVMMKKV